MILRLSISILLTLVHFSTLYASATAEPAAPVRYSINITWINNGLDPDQRYIYPSESEEQLYEEFMGNIFKWAEMNSEPDAIVNVWYDSVMTPATAIEETARLLSESRSDAGCPIELRDIREIPGVRENEDVFSDEIPVYFRADLVRVMAAVSDITSSITSSRTSCFIFANCNMPPISKAELFDAETLENMKKFGLVMGFNTTGKNFQGFENSFFIMTDDNPHMMEATNAMIASNIAKAKEAISKKDLDASLIARNKGNTKMRHTDRIKDLTENVYRSYLKMFLHFYSLQDKVSLLDLKIKKVLWEVGRGCVPMRVHGCAVPVKKISLPTAKLRYVTKGKGNHPSKYEAS